MNISTIYLSRFCLLLCSLLTFFACERDNIAPSAESDVFNEAYLKANPDLLLALTPELAFLELNDKSLTNVVFDADRLETLVVKESLDNFEVKELQDYLFQIGFPDKETFISFKSSLFLVGQQLVEETNIEDLSPSQIRSVIEEAILSVDSNSDLTSFERAGPCNSQSYQDCERDVSAALAGDLGECVVGAVVTGLFTGGLPGLGVGIACTANALYQGVIGSRACVRNYCP